MLPIIEPQARRVRAPPRRRTGNEKTGSASRTAPARGLGVRASERAERPQRGERQTRRAWLD